MTRAKKKIELRPDWPPVVVSFKFSDWYHRFFHTGFPSPLPPPPIPSGDFSCTHKLLFLLQDDQIPDTIKLEEVKFKA